MMKKFRIFTLALAALTLGACSSDDVVDQSPAVPSGSTGYVSLAINLPTQPSSRASENDVFADGDDCEYKVNDMTLFLFSGASEDAAKFSGAYTLTPGTSTAVNENITSRYNIVQEITRPSTTGNDRIYAMVVVNGTGVVTTGSDASGWKIGETELTENTTVADVKKIHADFNLSTIASRNNSGNFYMTNAPLYTSAGGATQPATDGKVVTLTEVNPANIFDTQEEARANPAASIYVERAVAKVTLTQDASFSTNSDTQLNPTLQGWVLDITNKGSYAVRNVTGADWWAYKSSRLSTDNYRFVGAAAVATNLYRTYWAYDLNYDGTDATSASSASYVDASKNVLGTYTGFNCLAGTAPTTKTTPTTLISMTNPGYCLENTFDINNMRKDQTTAVVIAAKLSINSTNVEANGDFCILNNNKSVGSVMSKAQVISYVKTAYLQNETISNLLTANLSTGSTIDASDIYVTFAGDGSTSSDSEFGTLNGGVLTISGIYVKSSAASKFTNSSVPTDLASDNANVTAALNNSIKISYYKEGIAYYPVRIQHFGNDLTPWTPDNNTVGSYPAGSNNDGNNDWLGRWGVLRNNWYEINVQSINSIGDPEIDTEYGDDDPEQSWINIEINILSWAKRSQNAAL